MAKYRSKFEAMIASKVSKAAVYEPISVPYVIPETKHKYTPDWVVGDYWVEAKGKLTLVDRKKMVLIKQQHPDKQIVFVFQNPNVKISKGSPTTYREWALSKGFIVWTVEQFAQFTHHQQ